VEGIALLASPVLLGERIEAANPYLGYVRNAPEFWATAERFAFHSGPAKR
jgi:hypothetical protein